MTYNHVTQVLSPFTDYSGIPAFILERAALRGTKAHAVCTTYALGLPVLKIDDSIKYFYEAFKRWFDAYVKRVLYCEKTLKDDIHKFTGRPDIVVILRDDTLWVIDIKTPYLESPTWRAQCAAYRHLVELDLGLKTEPVEKQPRCGALQMNPNRSTKVIPYQYHEDDFMAFLSALNAYRYFLN